MRAFCGDFNQVNSIFSSKIIILPKNRKNYPEIQRTFNFLGASNKIIKF